MNIWYLKIGKWIYCFGKISYETFKKILVMGSHYIQVGKLKLDKYLLDIACPAAGYGETPPDPAIYCPANEYEKIIPDYMPDPDIPEVVAGEGEIIMIVDSNSAIPIDFHVTRDSGGYTYDIYGEDDIIIDQNTSASTKFTYDFSQLTGGYGNRYFKAVLRPVSGVFTNCRISSNSVIYPIIEIYLNTPSLLLFNFDNCQLLKKVWMCDTMDSLNTTGDTYKVFQRTYSLEQITFPTSMAANTSMKYWFHYSGIPEIVFPAYMPNLSSIQYLCRYAKTKKITLPSSANVGEMMQYSFADMLNIKELTFPEGFFGVNNTAFVHETFINSSNFEKIVFPESTVLTGGYALFQGLSKLNTPNKDGIFNIKVKDDYPYSFYYNFSGVLNVKEIHYSGDINATITSNNSNCFHNSPFLKEVSLPNYLQNAPSVYLFYGGTPSLKKVNLPESMPNLAEGTEVCDLFGSGSHQITEQITTCIDWGTNYHTLNRRLNMQKLVIFDQPTLRLKTLIINGATNPKGKLEYLEIDWYNSVINGGLLIIAIGNLNLSESELNRIFTALPAAAGSISASGNPGFATCDPSIATAKGWTVT